MTVLPGRQFSANVGDKSVGSAGPDAIENDIDALRTWITAHKDSADTDHDGRYYSKTEIDQKFGANPVTNFKQASAPTIGTGAGEAKAGDTWYDQANNRWKYCNGVTWIDPMNYS